MKPKYLLLDLRKFSHFFYLSIFGATYVGKKGVQYLGPDKQYEVQKFAWLIRQLHTVLIDERMNQYNKEKPVS